MYSRQRSGSGCGLGGGRIIVGLVMAAFALISYFGSQSYNPITNENQHVNISPQQEVAMGLQAAPEMAQEYGGLANDPQSQAKLDQVCENLTSKSDAAKTDWPFECHLLADEQTINAFALPGGPVFITMALFQKLETEGELAGVMGHEIGHVVARHSAQQIAKQQLTQGLTGAAVIASYDPNNPRTQQTAAVAAMIGQLVNLRFGREDELQSDQLGVRFMGQAGYDPRSMIKVMQILEASSQGNEPPEFFSTHPNPENRITRIQEAIDKQYPNGVPAGLTP
ncbi:MAG: M48 family metalloprotease [Chloroflexi bacterium]|nr:M48 family metalloprotease [Chloroflexota bacterium]